MTSYFDLSVPYHIVFGVLALILMAVAVLIFVFVFALRLKRKYVIFSSALLLEVMFVLQGIVDVIQKQERGISHIFFSDIIGNMPSSAVLFLLLLSAVAEVLFLVYINNVRKNMLTPVAIKESLDALPDGVCFYLSDGQPLLVNAQMNKISVELFGTEIMNAETFCLNLKSDKLCGKAEVICAEPTVVIKSQDEKVWDFRLNTLSVGNSQVNELVAYDVTEQYHLNRELETQNKRLSDVNERLRIYSGEVEGIITEKEILTAKIRVHNNLGHSLLAFRSYLAKPRSERDKENLLLLWRYTVSVMKKEAVPSTQSNDLDLLLKAAQSVDVTIEQNGNLPEEGRERAAIIAMLHECLTNTVKHAKGNRLYLNIYSDNTTLTAEVTNNGVPPKSEIHETGGLKNLRNTVESAGGIMTINSTPRFLLRVEFPKGR